MDTIDDDRMQGPPEGHAPSRPVSDVLTMLRTIANPVRGHKLVDFHSHRLMTERRRISRPAEPALRDGKLTATFTCACASASAIGVLQMLSTFFE